MENCQSFCGFLPSCASLLHGRGLPLSACEGEGSGETLTGEESLAGGGGNPQGIARAASANPFEKHTQEALGRGGREVEPWAPQTCAGRGGSYGHTGGSPGAEVSVKV